MKKSKIVKYHAGSSVRLIVLGCPKNRADAESVAGYLQNDGFKVTEDSNPADVAIVLTCAFVRDAEEEAIENILSLIEERRSGRIGALIVTGCLPQRHRDEEVRQSLPEVDAWVGAADYPRIASIVRRVLSGRRLYKISPHAGYLPGRSSRVKLGDEPFAYVKISEGCRNRCAYCTIPSIRGDFRSRPMSEIVDESAALVDGGGVREIVLVGQDTALYGTDRYGESRLGELLHRVAKRIPNAWVRVMYAHPAHITDDMLDSMASHSNICPYLDVPIQHVATPVLKKMGRPGSKREIENLIARIRERIPGIVLRTTVMVGFPGETARDFKELFDFVKRTRIERLGAFPFSREEGTPAYGMTGQVRADVKQRRLDGIMQLQQEISWDLQQDWVGRELTALVDGPDPDKPGWSLARSMWHAPEVDAGIYIEKTLKPGKMIKVCIIDALAYDLEGVEITEITKK